jgi:hypothetical protein
MGMMLDSTDKAKKNHSIPKPTRRHSGFFLLEKPMR